MSLAQTARPLPSLRLAAPRRLETALLTLNVSALLIAALWLRVWQLDHVPGINGDEAWYGIQAMRLWCGEAVSLRTPTNNILNPFYFVPLAAVHALGPPSAALLRWPALLSGILALAVNYMLCRRVFDRTTALVTTLLLAVLPVNIAYSRFGWDTSQTLLATLPAVYLPLLAAKDARHRQRLLILAALAFVASLVVHPTNIFTAPLLVIPTVWARRDELLRSVLQQRPRWQKIAVGLTAATALPAVFWLARPWLAAMLARLASPAQLWEFVWHYERLFSGLTVYRFIAGSNLPQAERADWLVLDLAWWSIFGLAGCGLYLRIRSRTDALRWLDGCLICGWAAMLCGFFLVAGPKAVTPHFERYAQCLIAPAALLLGRGLSWWIVKRELRPIALAASLALGWLTLLAFDQHYFAFIERTGGGSHATFRTAELEPKQAALAEVLRQRHPDQVAWIVTAEYWNEKPLVYLASGDSLVRVGKWSDLRDSRELLVAAREGSVWFVEFEGSDSAGEVRDYLERVKLDYRESKINDFAGRPVHVLFCPARGPHDAAAGETLAPRD